MPSISMSGQSKQRQIVIVAVGGLILAGVLMFQLPRTLETLRGSESPAATEQPVSPVTPVTPASPVAPVPTTPSAPRPAALTRFKSKDPFFQQINTNPSSTEPESSGPSESSESSAPSSSEPTTERASFRAVVSSNRSPAAADSATIAVNGAEETVTVSNAFPKANPVFKLVSVAAETAKVGVASGTLKGGAQTVTLTKGEPLTLLNTVDGKRYKLELVSVSS